MNDFEEALAKEWKGYVDRGAATVDALEDNTQELAFVKGFYRAWNYPKQLPVSEDLEKVAKVYEQTRNDLDVVSDNQMVERAFKAGAEWQKKQDQSTIELAEDHAMLAGMEKMKEQMMAKAVDGDITFDYYGDGDKTYGCIAHNSFCLEDFGLKDGDKVKVIAIKED